MSVSDIDELNDNFYERVLKAKCDNPEMFVSNWEDDNADICSWTENEIREDPSKQLITAAEFGHLDTVMALLDTGSVDIDAEDSDGYRALHRACYNGHADTVKCLISRGADVNVQTKFGWTPLHSSVYWNKLECVQLLLRNGASVTSLTEGGQTPLHLACTKYDVALEILALLLSRSDADVALRNAQGDSCVDLAMRHTPYAYIFLPFSDACTALHQ